MLHSISQIIIANIVVINLILAVINISIAVHNWYRSRPKLVFYPNDKMLNIYKYSNPSEYRYSHSECIVFYYVKIFNNSSSPCSIGEFVLSVEGYEDTVFSSRVSIREKYPFQDSGGIYGSSCITMPLTIPPYGYCEGYLVFPFAPKYRETRIFCEVSTSATRKKFTTSGFIEHFRNNT